MQEGRKQARESGQVNGGFKRCFERLGFSSHKPHTCDLQLLALRQELLKVRHITLPHLTPLPPCPPLRLLPALLLMCAQLGPEARWVERALRPATASVHSAGRASARSLQDGGARGGASGSPSACRQECFQLLQDRDEKKKPVATGKKLEKQTKSRAKGLPELSRPALCAAAVQELQETSAARGRGRGREVGRGRGSARGGRGRGAGAGAGREAGGRGRGVSRGQGRGREGGRGQAAGVPGAVGSVAQMSLTAWRHASTRCMILFIRACSPTFTRSALP